MCSQTRNSCVKAFDNRSRSKNLKPKKSRGGVNLTPLKASRVNTFLTSLPLTATTSKNVVFSADVTFITIDVTILSMAAPLLNYYYFILHFIIMFVIVVIIIIINIIIIIIIIVVVVVVIV